MAKKAQSKTPPGAKARKTRQRKVKRYGKLRDELQQMDVLPTVPEGAVKSEVVSPSSQGEQLIVSIPLRAAREGWGTPDHKKMVVVDELVKLVEAPLMREEEGISGVPAVVKVMAANALGKLDQMQYERDNPERAGKAKGSIQIETTVNVVDETRRLLEAVDRQAGCDDIEQRLKAESIQVEQVESATGKQESNHAEAVAGGQGAVMAGSEAV